MTDDTTTEPLPELPCQDLVEVVTDYLDGALSAVDRRRFEEHLDDLRALRRLRRADPPHDRRDRPRRRCSREALPAELRDGIRDAFRDWAG